jgi:hypothetical protein
MMNDDGTAYAISGDELNGSAWKAMDVVTWQEKWPLPGPPVMALDGGGVVTHDGTTLKFVDSSGVVESTTTIASHITSSAVTQGEWISHNQDNSFLGEPIRAIVAPLQTESRLSFQGISAYASCINAPFLGEGQTPGLKPRSVAAGAELSYGFMEGFQQNDPRKAFVNSAFAAWTASVASALGTKFTLYEGAGVPHIQLRAEPIPDGDDVAADIQAFFTTSGGRDITGAIIKFNTSPTGFLTDPAAYLKTALHEIGHLMGLDDQWRHTSKKSVMNFMEGRNDIGESVSRVVTPCDRDRAIVAAFRAWP